LTWVNDPSTGQRSRRADSYRLAKKRSAQGIAQLFRPQLFEVLRAPPKVAAKIPESVPSTLSDRSGRLSQDGLALAVSREARKVAKMSSTVGASSIPRNIFSDVSRVILRHSTSGTTGRLVLK